MIYGLVGNPLGHSISPELHAMLGRSDYRLFELAEDELPAFFAQAELGGVNVTIPYKKRCMQFCGEVSPEAEAAGCVNTVVRRKDGRLVGYNTDVLGFISAVRKAGIDVSSRKCAVFGSGGASCAVKAALSILGADKTVTVSRRGETNYGTPEKFSDAEIVVNATPVGMWPNISGAAAKLSLFADCKGVIDVIYSPLRTDLLLEAEKRGIKYANGLSMLVSQAAETERIFGLTVAANEDAITAKLRRNTENIVLIGMPGAGKTTVGRCLSSLMNRPFFDTDTEIERASGMTIPEIFAEYGEAHFRSLERECIERAGTLRGGVISVGGGAVLDGRNYAPLRRNGKIYLIERPLNLLETAGRPLSHDLEGLERERAPLYRAFADARCDNTGSPEDAAKKILGDFSE